MTSTVEQPSPVDVVKAFISCSATKDLEHMRKLIHPKATACLIRGSEPRFLALSEVIGALEKAEQDFVEVSRDEVEHVDGEYATVRAAFSTYRDGELHHSGSSSYSCWKSPLLGWIILTMSDIARPPNDTARV